ncbi:MAG: hypothetical protein LBQ12_10660 [Deltaproteobacteria bacterium]|jgi:hypothetical protein|nr:hypothetical protein [Deltaproteobacteria bacterium]
MADAAGMEQALKTEDSGRSRLVAGPGRGIPAPDSGRAPGEASGFPGAWDPQRAAGLLEWFVILAAFAAVAASYVVYMARLPEYLNSDQAAEILTAREIIRQKTLFLREWYFSTEIFLVRTSLFMALWGLATDSFLGTYRLAAATDVALMCAAFAYMMRRLGADAKATVLGLVVFFGSRGYYSGQGTGLGGSSYGTLCATVFVILGYYAAARQKRAEAADRLARWAIPALAFLFGISSMRFLAVVLLPLLAAHLVSKVWSRLPSGWTGDRLLREILFWTALCLIGWTVTSRHVMPLGFGPADYSTPVSNGLVYIARESLPELLIEFFHYNQFYTVVEPFRLASLGGLNGALCILFFTACGAALIRCAGPFRPARRAVFMFLGISLAAATLSLFLFQPRINLRIRYLVFLYVLLAAAAGLGWRDLKKERPFAAGLFLALATVFCVANSCWNVRNIPSVALDSVSRVAVRHVPETVASFERHGVKRGFALFWDSGVQTAVSDGRIEVFPVTGALRPFRYLAPYSVFSHDRAGDPTAFIRVRLKLPPELAELPQFDLSRPEVLKLAYDVDVIPDPESDIEIYYFRTNPFTYPEGHDPKADRERDLADKGGA